MSGLRLIHPGPHGAVFGFAGWSGSGKTTLMNIIGCLDSPSNGTYMLNNRSSKLWKTLEQNMKTNLQRYLDL